MGPRVAYMVLAIVAGLAPSANAQLRGDTILRGLRNPVAVVPLPHERGTYLVVEQRGLVHAARDGELLDEPFLDLRNDVSTGGERGLLGLALAPDYETSRRFFVNFTNRSGDTVIARFTTNADNPLRATSESRFDLQWPTGRRVIEQPFSNHNGGHLVFGPDGYLYIGLGDGGSGGDPFNHAQRPDSLLGKMLRLDINVGDEDARGYRVPDDNPFADGDPLRAAGEIWAFGLRNPWRYSFDDGSRGGTWALLIGDVGQSAREEINLEPSGRGGRNYGWRIREGRQLYEPLTDAVLFPLTEPIHDYGRSVGASITGGYVYRGAALDPAYNGRYFYADFISGRVFSIGLHLDAFGEGTADDEREHTAALGGRDVLGMVSSFAQDHDGELLLVNYAAGTIVRVVPDLSVAPASPIGLALTFLDGQALLEWSFGVSDLDVGEFMVERVRDGGVSERVIVQRPTLAISAQIGDCFRVRARARSGVAGPPTAPMCIPRP